MSSPDSNNSNNYEAELRPHTYDGIQEFDNRLPNWWLWTLYTAIIFSFAYWFLRYDANFWKTDGEIVAEELARMEAIQLAQLGELDDETLWKMSENPAFVNPGQEIYNTTCSPCHAPNLQGMPGSGLNLVDDEWKWGNHPTSVYHVISNGSPENPAMQSWSNQLGSDGIKKVVAYILSHHTREEMAAARSLNPPVGLK